MIRNRDKLLASLCSSDAIGKGLIRILIGVLLLRVFVGLISIAWPMTGPHQWRQADTMGISMRYWSRWTNPGDSGAYPLLPAVLQSGDSRGIVPSELPLLPILSAPAFGIGVEWGRRGAQGILVVLVTCMIAICHRVWRGQRFGGVFGESIVLLAPFFSFCAPFAFKFIPDVLAMLCALCGIGYLCRGRNLWAWTWLSVGILLKPTSVITVFPAIWLFGSGRLPWRRFFVLSLACVPGLLYFTAGRAWIDSLRDGRNIFRIHPNGIAENISSVWRDLDSLISCLNYHLFLPFGAIALFLCLFQSRSLEEIKKAVTFIAILGAQILFILMVDGNHAFTHVYYFLGVAPFAAFGFLYVWNQTKARSLRALLAIILIGRTIDVLASEAHSWLKPDSIVQIFHDCSSLKKSHPEIPWGESYVFRSPGQEYSLLGVCFGERLASDQSNWGFFQIEDREKIPSDCVEIAAGSHVGLLRCGRAKH